MLLSTLKNCLQLHVAIIGLSVALPFPSSNGRNELNVEMIMKPASRQLENEIDEAVDTEDPSFFKESRPEESGYFEGDIVGINGSDFTGRNAIRDMGKKWPNGIIPYTFKSFFTSKEKLIIYEALEDFHKNTCIRFVARTDERHYIRFTRGKGCYSNVGRVQNGYQDVSIGVGCSIKGIVIHELMHAAGFWHEQSRADRDNHIIIHWENIKRAHRRNFLKYSWMEIQHLNESYDIESVMHYGPYAFSQDQDLKTIEPRNSSHISKMGQRVGFSNTDIIKINKLYSCSDDNSVATTTPEKQTAPNLVQFLLQLLNKKSFLTI